jgi:hypothetical protein
MNDVEAIEALLNVCFLYKRLTNLVFGLILNGAGSVNPDRHNFLVNG